MHCLGMPMVKSLERTLREKTGFVLKALPMPEEQTDVYVYSFSISYGHMNTLPSFRNQDTNGLFSLTSLYSPQTNEQLSTLFFYTPVVNRRLFSSVFFF